MRIAPDSINDIKNKREFDPQDLAFNMKKYNTSIIFSWAARGWINYFNKALVFRVSGFKFKGNVMISLNAMDLFDIEFFTIRGTLKHSMNDIFVGDLVEHIDNFVEKTDNYKEDIKKEYSIS